MHPSCPPLPETIRRDALAAFDPAISMVVLGDDDRERFAAHLLRLDDDDRRMRFMRAMTDRDIEAYAARASDATATRLAFCDATGAVRAVCEGFVHAAGHRLDMELAFSTDAAWRRRGLAGRLFEAMRDRARAQGIARLVLHCDRRNASMRGALRAFGAVTNEADGEIDAFCPAVVEHA